MPSEADYRSQAEALLRLAAAADNMRVRSELIDEASRWHALAMKAGAESEDNQVQRPAESASFATIDEGRRIDRPRRLSPLRWFLRLS